MEQKNEKQRLQEKYTELQVISQQIQGIQEQINSIFQQSQELMKLRDSLVDIQNIKKENKALIPIGSSIFLEGTIQETDKVVMGVGAGVCVKKNTNDAVLMIENQIKELDKIGNQLNKQASMRVAYIHNLQEELKGMAKE